MGEDKEKGHLGLHMPRVGFVGNVIGLVASTIGLLYVTKWGEERDKATDSSTRYFDVSVNDRSPQNSEVQNLEKRIDELESELAEKNESFFGDVGNFLSDLYTRDYSGFLTPELLHDGGATIGGLGFGILGAGLGRAKNGLIACLAFAQVPELFNIYEGNIIGSEIFDNLGHDALLIGGAYMAGTLLNSMGVNPSYMSRKYDSYDDVTKKKWWN